MKKNRSFIFKYCKQYYAYIFFLVATILINAFLATYPIKLIEKLIDISTQNVALKMVLYWGGIYLIVQILWVITDGIVSLLSNQLEIKIGHQIRMDLFCKIERLPMVYFDENASSNMLLRLAEDSAISVDNILKPIVFLSLNIIQFILGFYFICTISYKVAIIMIPIGLSLALLSVKSGPSIRTFTKMQRDSVEDLWNKFLEGIKNIKLIKAYSKETDYGKQVDQASLDVCKKSEKLSKYTIFLEGMYSSLFMILIAFIMVYGSVQVRMGALTIGGLSALMMYNGLLIDPMLNFFNFYQQIQQIQVSYKKISAIFEEEEEDYRQNLERKSTFDDKIKIQELSFGYSDREVLHNINLSIEKGEHIAFVGLSGAGKSTIYNLLMGFYQVEGNHIFIDGLDTTRIRLKDLRDLFGIVFQDSMLIDGTIRDNLMLINNDVNDEKMLNALKLAGLEELILRIPEGLDTLIGENGSKLSGGEKQRLEIARIFLVHPEILILDEATSALDTITCEQITKNILNHYKNNTVIFTIHKLQGIVEQCDKILVFSQGEIVDQGTHDELLRTCNLYKKLYYRESKDIKNICN